MELWVATGNAGKLRELVELLSPHGYDVRGLADLEQELDIVEDADTFAANAAIKARALYRATGTPALADDSGLMVDALRGAPGVHSARYADETGAARDQANYVKLLAALDGVPDDLRGARFVCALVYIDAQGVEHLFEGVCDGAIGHRPRGDNGFGYDPIFLMPGTDRTMAQLDPNEKNAVSHRGKAVRAFVSYLVSQ